MEPGELYGLALDEFIPERGRLAKALRAEGKREEAGAVAALRKPSLAAWAVNQLFRTQHGAIEELIAAGDALREAQSALLERRGDGPGLREAMQRERDAVDGLLTTARGLLSSEGHELSPSVRDRVGDTLHAIALSDEAREAVGDGRLERELRHVGLGVDGLAAAPPRAKPPAEKQTQKQEDREQAEARKRAERERDEARKAARGAEADARRRAERGARALRTAEERHAKALRALQEAEAALSDARAEADDAAAEHERARTALDEL